MKNYQSKLSIITLAVLTSLGAQAGSVTSTFNTGDTLTATQMNEIKNAVNDNDTRVTTNTQSIANSFSGDGSAGDITIDTTNDDWADPAEVPANPNFANITIDAGQTLTVPAGTTIRCSGSFTNNGTLQVQEGAKFQAVQVGLNTSIAPTEMISAVSHPGDALSSATLGNFNNLTTQSLNGGTGGRAIPEAVTVTSFSNFRFGGGSGIGYFSFEDGGGGLVKIYCSGAILNAASANIIARGGSGPFGGISGGGGGIVVLASRTSIDNAGVIDVSGGDGAPSTSYASNSGGGGGGIIVMVAPTTPEPGTAGVNTIVDGGLGGAGTATVTATARMAGSGGGGSGGNGGNGASASAGTTSVPASAFNGDPGYIVTMTLDPITVAR